MKRLIFLTFSVLITQFVNAQITKDTIVCGKYLLTIDVPDIGYKHSKIDSYENVFFKTYPNIDTSYILIAYGSIRFLPILKNKESCSEYKNYNFGNIVTSIRGSCGNKYFREDIYHIQKIVILYENVDESQYLVYDSILNNILIKRVR